MNIRAMERQRMVFRFEAPGDRPPLFDPEIIQEARTRLLLTFGILNLGICLLAGGAGYFLAGKTLRPIQEMVDEQKRFITDASHELRTPLTSLRTEIEVAMRDKKLTANSARKLLESNLEEVVHLQLLSDSLLSLATTQTVAKNAYTTFTVTDLIEVSLKKVSGMAKKKKIEIKKQLTNAFILGDKQALGEVIVIMLDNAIKYSQKSSSVTIKAIKKNNSVQIHVIDQGIGIAKHERLSIFDRFYRADKARAGGETSGYGLGLSIAKKIVEEHQGTISVSGNTETIFTVVLPQAKASD